MYSGSGGWLVGSRTETQDLHALPGLRLGRRAVVRLVYGQKGVVTAYAPTGRRCGSPDSSAFHLG